MKTTLSKLFLSACLLFNAAFVIAQAGTLDSSFGVNGKLTTNFFMGTDTIVYAKAVALQPDSKIVVAGYFYVYDYHANFLVARYQANGNLDSSFGINGKVITYFTRAGLATTYPKTVMVLPDGKILVGGYRIDAPGYSPNEIVLSQGINHYSVMARYMPNGDLDSSFGVNGQVQYLIGAFSVFGNNSMAGIAILKDSSIVTAGYMNGLCVIKFHSNGTLDSSFASNGRLLDPLTHLHTNDIAIDQEGRILLAGYDYLNLATTYEFAVRRLLPSGIYDSSYGNSGIVKTDFFNQNDIANSLIIMKDESIVVAGYADSSNTRKIALVKYDVTGVADSSFGINGKATYSFGSMNIYATKLLAQPNGKLIVTGEINDLAFLIGRFESNGAVDVGFGINGVDTTSFGDGTLLKSAALQADGKILCAGRPFFSVARFKGDDPVIVSIKKKISVTEGNTSTTTQAQFKVVLNKPATSDVFVNYTTKDLNATAGSDYTSASGTLRIKAGKVSGNVVVPVIGDNTREVNEKFALVLSNPVNAILGTLDSATCTIKNDDPSFAFTNSSTQEDISISNKSVKIFPNPVKDVLNIQGLSTQDKIQISILDINGHVLVKKSISTSSYVWNIKSLTVGSYFLQLQTKEKVETYPFVKQ